MPRRFAPRNDRGRYALASAGAWQVPAHLTRQTFLHPLTRLCLLHVIANQCAHWCGNPRPCREPWQLNTTLANPQHFPVFALGTALCHALPQDYGLPRRFAPRNDMQKLTACSHCKEALPGKFAPACAFTRQPPCPRTHLPAFRCHCGDVSQTQRQRFFAGIFPFAPSPWGKNEK